MGCRITGNLLHTDYRSMYVELSPDGIGRLAPRGLAVTPTEMASAEADIAIPALPDNLIGRVAPSIGPHLRAGAMVISLDPAAPQA